MNTEKRITLACFIGATIGALLALQFNRHFWWLGIFLGGGIAYVAYDFKRVVKTVQMIWKSIPEAKELYEETRELRSELIALVKGFGITIFLICIGICTIGALYTLVHTFFVTVDLYVRFWTSNKETIFRDHKDIYTNVYWLGGTVVTLIVAVTAAITTQKMDSKANATRIFLIVMAFSPVSFPIALPIFVLIQIIKSAHLLISCLDWLTRMVPVAVWKTAKKTFILVHSEIRLLCMTDAMLGALAGYFLGNALLGGLIGAASGILNYRLVSIKLLKLAKA
jgi:hypothetical protein